MRATEAARAEVEKREDDLKKWQAKKTTLEARLHELKTARPDAEDAKRKKIDQEIYSLTLDLEDLERHIRDAEGEIQKAENALQEAEADQKTRLNQFILDRTNEFCDRNISSLQNDIVQWAMDCKALGVRLGQIQLKGLRALDGQIMKSGELEKGLFALPQMLSEVTSDCRRSLLRGYGPPLEIFPLFQVPPEFPRSATIDPGNIAKDLFDQLTQKWIREFYNKEK